MIKLKELLLEDKKSFVGDCRTIVDQHTIFSDATEMAQAIENSKPMSYSQFMAEIDMRGTSRMFHLRLRKNPDQFTFGRHSNLVWAYDSIDDIHYFFI